MKIIKKIWDYVAQKLSKHYWRECYLEYCSRHYKAVDAKTLADIRECINPSYRHPDVYAWRTHDSSLAEEEELASIIEGAGLQEHILLSDEGNGKAIKFVNLKIKDDFNLNLSVKFNRWEFHRIKFDKGIGISVFPSFKHWNTGAVVFNKIICRNSFWCMYAGVSNIRICDSILPSVSMKIGVPKPWVTAGQMGMMMRDYFCDSIAPTVEFSGNYIKDLAPYTELTPTDPDEIANNSKRIYNLGSVSFVKGNYIGALRLLTSMLPYDKSARDDRKVRTFFPGDEVVSVARIHFDPHERIEMPSDWEEKMKHKEYFVALKNQATRRCDREAEFSHGRKERYFDRGLANRWQDKFILGWSHYVSDSGISWIRPAAILLVGQWLLAAIFIGLGWCDWDWWVWGKLAVESLNPLSQVESGCASPLSAAFYGVARKIFLFLFLYEIIKVFRRFSK